jgi:TP901-1 family phage major tail protein
MSKQKGRLLLIKIGDGEVSETFLNLCGLNSKALTINNASIDVTTPNCSDPEGALWTETLSGVKNMTASGDGFFEDSVAEARANTVAMAADNQANFQIIVPDFGTYAGAFRIASMDFGAETEGGVTYGLSLESNGAITFTAA